MKSMRELMEAVMAEGKGKGDSVTQNHDASNKDDFDHRVEMPEIVREVAAVLGWTRSKSVTAYPFLRGANGLAFPRVFTKSNVEFILFGESSDYMLVAAKRRDAQWAPESNQTNDMDKKNPHAVVYYRIRVSGRLDYNDLARRVKEFTQKFKRLYANSDGKGVTITS